MKNKKNNIMKIRIVYTWKDLLGYIRRSMFIVVKGFCRIIWIAALLVMNAFIHAYNFIAWAIRRRPCMAVLVTFLLMAAVNMFTYCSVKTRLTTAEWQRDKAVMQRDSIHEATSETAEYSRIK